MAAFSWFGSKSLKLVGDEGDYVRRGRSDDPFAPTLFLRVPLIPFLAMVASRFGNPEQALRRMMVLASLLAYLLTMVGGWVLGGEAGALGAGLVLLLFPERGMMSKRIWPEPILSLWLAALQLVLIQDADIFFTATLSGVLVMLASLTRIEQLVLLPAVLLVLFLREASISIQLIVLVCGPTFVAFSLWSMRCRLKYGTWLPDNTWCFNLSVLLRELQSNSEENMHIKDIVSECVPQWEKDPDHSGWESITACLRVTKANPMRLVVQFLQRMISLLGPDTFVSQCIMGPKGNTKGRLGAFLDLAVRCFLKVSVPIVVACFAVTSFAFCVVPPIFLVPALFVFLSFAVVHTRTRFRVSLFPSFALWAVVIFSSSNTAALSSFDAAGIWVAILVMAALLLLVVRNEMDQPGAPPK